MGNKSKARYPFERSTPEPEGFITPHNQRRLERNQKHKQLNLDQLAMAEQILTKPRPKPFRLLDPRSWFKRTA